jgi:hypothetical protein
LAAATVIAVGVPSIALATGEGNPLRQGARNPSSNASLALTRETQIIADSPTYGTRQSNKRNGDGGGAIYGCRSALPNEPCVKAVNLNTGHAFEFTTRGKEGGSITVGDPAGAPFTTNATGVATGLNADRVDGKSASDFAAAADVPEWAVVTVDGKLDSKRGATDAKVSDAAKGTYTVTFDRDVHACAFTATAQGTAADPDVAFAVSPAPYDPKSVLVDQSDDAAHRSAFHLQVDC